VLVEEAAEPVAAVDFDAGRMGRWLAGVAWLELERAVRPLSLVVIHVDALGMLEVAAVEDQ
jgi:hypothetical protein